jgi:hypothetical protein
MSNSVTAEICHLPSDIDGTPIKDTTDLWEFFQHDDIQFYTYLSNLSQWSLPTNTQVEYATDTDYFSSSLYAEITRKLGLDDASYNSDGWSRTPVPDPCATHEHDDIRPAFYWNDILHIGRCFKCGKSYLTIDVAKALGIDYHQYKNMQSAESSVPSIFTTDNQIKSAQKEAKVNASANVFNDTFSAEVEYLEGQYDQLDDADLMHTLSSALDTYEARFKGAVLPQYPPLPNPIEKIHYLGGNAEIIRRPSMVGLIGRSGGYKTSMLMYIITKLVKLGYNGIVFSPEWDSVTQLGKIVQSEGGAKNSRMLALQRYYYEQSLINAGEIHPESDELFGQDLTDVEKSRTLLLVAEREELSLERPSI